MKLIPNTISRTLSRQLLKVQKQSPHILFAAGVVGVIGGTVLACRATLKLGPVLDEFKADLDGVKKDLGSKPETHEYNGNDYRKDIAYVYIRDTAKIAKLYAPAIVVGGASIAALTGSHVTLTRRNAGLTAAFTAVSTAYAEYRERVKDEVGEKRELELYHAARVEQYVEGGKTHALYLADPNRWSPYARFFEESNRNWQKNPELNLIFINCQQKYANHLLQARGHIFLNEVYDMLGIEHSSAGAVVGWVIGDKGDNYIDFGIYEAANAAFVNNWEPTVILDFNVDGVIYDRI